MVEEIKKLPIQFGRVTNPTSESNWEDSNIYTITWTSRGTISRVFIGLYKESTYVEDVIL
ncbi:hypothetical protein LCGC14_1930730, partial [marine sediment metagenome]